MKFLLHPAGVTYDLGRGGGIICPTWHRTAVVHCITLYKQVQAITDKYKQIKTIINQYKQILANTNNDKQIQAITSKSKYIFHNCLLFLQQHAITIQADINTLYY